MKVQIQKTKSYYPTYCDVQENCKSDGAIDCVTFLKACGLPMNYLQCPKHKEIKSKEGESKKCQNQ